MNFYKCECKTVFLFDKFVIDPIDCKLHNLDIGKAKLFAVGITENRTNYEKASLETHLEKKDEKPLKKS